MTHTDSAQHMAGKGPRRTLLIDADAMASALTDPALAEAVLAQVDAADPKWRTRAAMNAIAYLVNEAARKATIR